LLQKSSVLSREVFLAAKVHKIMFKFFSKKSKVAESDSTTSSEVGGDTPDTPWPNANRAHENRILRVQAQIANWRMFAFFCLVLAFLAVGGMIWTAMQSKFIPMVMEVDKLGQVLAVKALTGDEAVSDPRRLVYREMFDLIENLRTVTTDRQANNDRLSKGFSRLTGAAERYVRTELRKAPPNEVGATKTVQVIVRSALPLTGKSWQVDWEERSRNLAGEDIGVERWRATVQFALSPSGEEKLFRRNPIGYVVPEISWQRVVQ
jgi:type IV secretion system protein VirB5